MRQWTVRTRLAGSFGLLLLLLSVVGAISANRLRALRESVHVATIDVAANVNAANSLINSVNEAARYKLAIFSTSNTALVAQWTEEVTKSRAGINAAYARLDSLAHTDSASKRLGLAPDSALAAHVDGIKALRKVHAASFDSAAALRKAGNLEGSERLLTDAVLPSLREYVAAIDSLVSVQQQRLAAEAARADGLAARGVLLIVLVLVLAIAAGVTVAWRIYLSVTVPLGALTRAADQLAVGNCDVQLHDDGARDEVATLAASMRRMAIADKSLATAAHALAKGDVSIAIPVRGEGDVLGLAMTRVHRTLVALETETSALALAAEEGRLEQRANAASFEGAFQVLLTGLNHTLEHLLSPVHEARTTLERLADRDLSARMSTGYRGDHGVLARALNAAADALDHTLAEVAGASQQVNAAATQIADGSQTLARNSSDQAATIEEVSGGLHELSSVTARNAEHAREALSLAVAARESSASGVREMTNLSEAVARIKHSSDSTARIVKSIDEIAFQTNLLALNAAVEAARAGDAGRGFAVVAEEVRSLALRSAEAARQTTALIEQSVQSANEGVSLNAAVLNQLGDIDRQVARVSVVMTDVAEGSEQQRLGLAAIGKSIEGMNTVTQSVAANAEESASASEELAGQATTLTSLVQEFTLTNDTAIGRHVIAGARTRRDRMRLTA